MKKIAVTGCTIEYSIDNGSVALVAVVAPASGKVSSGGNKAYTDKITITVVSGTVSLNTLPAGASSKDGMVPPGSITIDASTTKTSSVQHAFVCEGDEGSSSFECTFPAASGTNPIVVPITIKAKVQKAGQNVVNAT